MVKPDTHTPPAAVRSSARHPSPAFFQQPKTTICPGPRLPAHRDDDGIAPEAEPQPRLLRLQVQDHAHLVLRPGSPEKVRAWVADLPAWREVRYLIMPHPRLLAVSANVPTTSIRYGSKTLEKCQRRVTLVILCISNQIHNPTERGRDEVACPQMMRTEEASAHGLGKRR
jgi:hypothetical protein